MVLYLVPNDVPAVSVLAIPAIPAPHWDDVIVISSDEDYSSDEEYSNDDEKYDIPEDYDVPAVPGDDIIVISIDEESEMPAKKMGSYRSKEDDVAKISMSVYVTNFPGSISAKELFNPCKVYGHVLDSFIPNKRVKNDTNYKPILLDFREPWVVDLSMAEKGDESNGEMEAMSQSTMVMDDECLITWDLSNSLMGRVKVFASLANFKMALNNEGIPLKLWSVKTFSRIANKWGELLDVDDQEDSCFHSKRLCVLDFLDEEELEENNENAEGVKEQNLDLFRDDSEDERIPETMFQDDVQGDINMEDGVYEQGTKHLSNSQQG
nr:nucleotide-binding alpha-beta plait domain-containing protein [Tanacetum cinerariifolium]